MKPKVYVRKDGQDRRVEVKLFADNKGKINSLQRKTEIFPKTVHKEVFAVSDGERFQRALREELKCLQEQSIRQGNLIERLEDQIVPEEAEPVERLGFTAKVIAYAYARASSTSK